MDVQMTVHGHPDRALWKYRSLQKRPAGSLPEILFLAVVRRSYPCPQQEDQPLPSDRMPMSTLRMELSAFRGSKVSEFFLFVLTCTMMSRQLKWFASRLRISRRFPMPPANLGGHTCCPYVFAPIPSTEWNSCTLSRLTSIAAPSRQTKSAYWGCRREACPNLDYPCFATCAPQ